MKNEFESEIAHLIQNRIKNLRPKLLDFTARNPLIQTRFSEKGSSHVRAVDELPDILLHNLNNGVSMKLTPLPDLDIDPKDEVSKKFQSTVALSRRSDELFNTELLKLDENDDNFLSQSFMIEREMKDRVREQLQMPKRQTKTDIDIKTHARNNNINPSYDLPLPDEGLDDEKHTDTDIQTLILPRNLERRLNAIRSKDNSFAQETGINVLNAAFGFLEWKDPKSQKNNLSPLILMPIRFEIRKTPQGAETWVKNSGEEPTLNLVLQEKLRLEFGVELPDYNGGSIEDYLKCLADEDSGNLRWKPKRYIAFGIFPSSRMAMYFDLDTATEDFSNNPIIAGLFAGNPIETTTAFAEDHEVDTPENERKIPFLVKEADVSQLSTLIDIADGKNLAVEGPPGTGKSQTIVNAIAAALASGKRVLFIAEKAAALEVVQSRLEAVGLGEFALPLIAGRSSRDAVLQSVRERIDMLVSGSTTNYETEINRYRKTRDELTEYSQILSSTHDQTGLTVHDVLGNSIATARLLETRTDKIRFVHELPNEFYHREKLDELSEIASSYVSAWNRVSGDTSMWKGTNSRNLVKFQIEAITRKAKTVSEQFNKFAERLTTLESVKINSNIENTDISFILETVSAFVRELGNHITKTQSEVLSYDAPEEIQTFLNTCDNTQQTARSLDAKWVNKTNPQLVENMRKFESILIDAGLTALPIGKLRQTYIEEKERLLSQEKQWQKFKSLCEKIGSHNDLTTRDILLAKTIIFNAGTVALDHRTNNANQSGYSKFLRQTCQNGRVLKAKLEQIEKIFISGVPFDATQISYDIATFKNAGSLRALSGEFRKAKKRYLAFARDAEFEISIAVQNLQFLLEFNSEKKEYTDNSRTQALLGLQFDGINSDFDTLESLTEFYENINMQLSRPELVDFRVFLKEAPTFELLDLPNFGEDIEDQTYTKMRENFDESRKKVEVLSKVLENIAPFISEIKSTENTDASILRTETDQLEKFLLAADELDKNESMQKLLCNDFFGWKTSNSNLRATAEWSQKFVEMGNLGEISNLIVHSDQMEAIVDQLKLLPQEAQNANDNLFDLCNESGLDFKFIVENLSPPEIAERFRIAADDGTNLGNHSQLAEQRHQLNEVGFGWVLDELSNDKAVAELPGIINAIIWRVLSQNIYKQSGSRLAQFNGNHLNELRGRLVELDKRILDLSREQLRSNLLDQASPPYGVGVGKKSEYSELALLLHQLSLKKPNIPLRKLTKRAGKALIELKPCWMMSPLAVAQYLERGSLEFDLCIIDEASQMPPEDAVGALVRSKQAVIVGDTNQLPPSNFFRKMLEDEETDEDEQTMEESILEMANSTFRPKRRLRWHYRSRHSGLIKLSNRLIYDDKLIVFPSPDETRQDLGVFFKPVVGNYKGGINSQEAEVVAHAAIDFMINHPKRSLGVVALNKAQTEQIDALIYEASLDNRAVQKYREYWEEYENGIERFFVKNLENVQGDERDVIFISTVYGPSEVGGKTAQRFGPINGLAGKRRLNVLFSRAKEQVTTFSSMTASDILADPITNPGANMLKQWLEYSATGNLDGGTVDDSREPDSDFERHVISVINGFGFEAVPQVGVSGYFVDIGVKHPEWPHGFLIGIECDGASYHSSRSARDRDRLRQEILEGLGWNFYRIWSTDWFNDLYGETNKLRESIEERLRTAKIKNTEPTALEDNIIKLLESEQAVLPLDQPEEIKSNKQTLQENNDNADEYSGRADSVIEQIRLNGVSISTSRQAIDIGDTVRVRLTSDQDRILEFKISDQMDEIENGILYHSKPLAAAVLDKEDGDDFEYLVGSYVKTGTIEQVIKSKI